MKKLGIDDKGWKMVLTDGGHMRLIDPTGRSASFTRDHIVGTIAEYQAQVDRWQSYLTTLDGALKYLRDDKGAIVHCQLCNGPKLETMCVEGEFSCNDLNREHACEGWSDACCECGYAYGQCQM